jgi:hypothetical protein
MNQKPHIFLRSRQPLLYKCSGCGMTFEPERSPAALAERFRSHLSAHGMSEGLTHAPPQSSEKPLPQWGIREMQQNDIARDAKS